MITKSKAKSKPSIAAIAEGERLHAGRILPEAKPLTDVDRTEALELLWTESPEVLTWWLETRPEQLADRLEDHFSKNRVGMFVVHRSGLPRLYGIQEGIKVQAGDRFGVLSWDTLAAELAMRESDDEASPAKPANGKKIKAAAPGLPEPVPPRPPAGVDVQLVPIGQIVLCKDNPRKTIDDAKLAELAESIKGVGIIEPLVVRPLGKERFEIVAGERRWRAAKLAGLSVVPAWIRQLTDTEAAEIRLVENLQREDLNAIDEAHGFADLMQRFKLNQEQAAAKLGCTQGHVANRVGLLRLPEVWQAKIISREIPATHARVLAKYAEHPAILKEIKERVSGRWSNGIPTNYKMFEQQVESAALQGTEPLSGRAHSDKGGWGPVPKFTAAQLVDLQVIKVGNEQRATNLAVWNELFDAAAAKRRAAEEKRSKTAKKGGSESTAAQKKANAQKQAEALKRWVANWRSDWLRRILADLVIEHRDLAVRTMVMAIAYGCRVDGEFQRVEELVAPRTPGLKCERAVAGDTAAGAMETLVQLASEWCWDDDQAKKEPGSWEGRRLDEDAVEALAEVAGIDLPSLWSKASTGADRGGCAAEALFNRLTTAELQALAAELGIKQFKLAGETYDVAKAKKGDLVDGLLETAATWKRLPKLIKPVNLTRGKKPAKKARAK